MCMHYLQRSSRKVWLRTDFCYSFSFSSSLFFLGEKRKGEKNNQSRGLNSFLSARSYLQIILKVFQISLKNDQKFGQVLSRKKNIVQFFSTHRVFHSWLFYSSDPKKDPCPKILIPQGVKKRSKYRLLK